MNSLNHLVEKYSVPTKVQDSAALKTMQPTVVLPQNIELKLQRPSIKLLPTPNDSSFQQRKKTFSEKNTKEQELSEPLTKDRDLLSQSDTVGADTLDIVLIHNWISSGFKQPLWFSPSNDSVCFIPYNYFSGTHSNNSPDKIVTSNSSDNNTTLLQKSKSTTESYTGQQETPFNSLTHYNLLSEAWFVTVLIIFVAITGFVRLKWQKYLSKVFQSITFANISTNLQASSGSKEKAASFLLNILFYGNFSLFLYELMVYKNHTYIHWEGWSLWLLIAAFLIAIINLKTIVYKFIGWVFRIQKQTTDYLFQSSVMNKAYGVILMPLVVLLPFLEPEARPILIKVGLAAFILLYLIQMARGIGSNLRNALSVYYIILYLCALEILPLSILYKVLFH